MLKYTYFTDIISQNKLFYVGFIGYKMKKHARVTTEGMKVFKTLPEAREFIYLNSKKGN